MASSQRVDFDRSPRVCVKCLAVYVPVMGKQTMCGTACRAAAVGAPPAASLDCPHCGAQFAPGAYNQKFCGNACKVAAHNLRKQRPCASCGGLMWRSRTSRAEGVATCNPCRRATSLCGTVAGYDKRNCRCQTCRDAKAASMRAYMAAYRERTGDAYRAPSVISAKVQRACVDCSCKIRQAMTDQPRCKACWREWRSRSRIAKTRRRRAEAKLAKAAVGVPANLRWTFVQGTCAGCGEMFTRRGQSSRYCSKRCSGRAVSAHWISKSARLAIYERDNWICQLCLDPIDPSLHYLDIWAASLDHIECQSWVLIPDHRPQNLRTCHRWCNSVRGNESHYTEADLRTETRRVAAV